jgi:hypothetical protein
MANMVAQTALVFHNSCQACSALVAVLVIVVWSMLLDRNVCQVHNIVLQVRLSSNPGSTVENT